jgi:hypothetical protein
LLCIFNQALSKPWRLVIFWRVDLKLAGNYPTWRQRPTFWVVFGHKPSKSKIWTRRTGYLLRKPPGTCLEICRCKGQSKLSEMEWHGLYMSVVKIKNFNHYNTIEHYVLECFQYWLRQQKGMDPSRTAPRLVASLCTCYLCIPGFQINNSIFTLILSRKKWREHLSYIHNYIYNIYIIYICILYFLSISHIYVISIICIFLNISMFTFLYHWMPRRSAGYADGNEAVFYANGVEFYRAWHGRTSVAQRHKRLKHNGYCILYIYIHDIIYLWIVD